MAISVLAQSCGAAAPRARRAAPAAAAVHYEFSLTRERRRLEVRVCAQGALAGFRPMHQESARRVSHVVDDATSEPLTRRGGRWLTSALGERPCIRYRIDLTPAFNWAGVLEVDDDLMLATGAFLLAPEPRDDDTQITAEFDLPEGESLAPIWPRGADGRLRLDERAFRFVGYTAIGTLDVEHVGVPGGCLDIAFVGERAPRSRAERIAPFETVARAASRITGRFPAERALLVVNLLEGEGDVGFGIAGRGPIPSVALFVGRDASAAQIAGHYTPVHEFSHFATPYIPADEAWLGEGIATFYQEVLRAREGLVDETAAWQQFVRGLGAAARDWRRGETLREAAARMRRDGVYGRVYWSGAAIALLADLALRRQGDSLDARVAQVADRRDEILSSAELCLALDGGEQGIFTAIARQHLDGNGPPDLSEALEWMGVRVRQGRVVELDAEAPGASLRASIMNESPELASIPSDCAE